jgi:hypothetical protein
MQGKVQNASSVSSRSSATADTQSPAKNKPRADNRNKPAPNVSHKAPSDSSDDNQPLARQLLKQPEARVAASLHAGATAPSERISGRKAPGGKDETDSAPPHKRQKKIFDPSEVGAKRGGSGRAGEQLGRWLEEAMPRKGAVHRRSRTCTCTHSHSMHIHTLVCRLTVCI